MHKIVEKKFAVFKLMTQVTGKNSKCFRRSAKTAFEPVQNDFINDLVTVNSKERFSLKNNELASKLYNEHGMHLARIKIKITPSHAKKEFPNKQ